MVDQLVACKHGRQPIKKMHPLIDDILKPTYDVIVYLDQVMQIAQKLANYSLGGADLLRRAMGNKKKEEMDQQTDIFLKDAVQNNVDPAKAKEIFDLVAQFAKYGFNRSHSAGYASVTYQSAYLKAHFTAEFLCALMTADREKTEKVVRIIDEGRAMGVEILAPDINGSDTDFKVVYEALAGDWSAPRGARLKDSYHPKIRFGLGAVRGVGDAALEFVFEARRDGPFKDLFDFCSRVDARKLNRGVLEALVQCGAFDATLRDGSVTRAQAFAAIDLALDRGRSASKDRVRGQTTLFGLFDAASDTSARSTAEYPSLPPWDLRDTCAREKQALGFYVSGHPLDRYGNDFERFHVSATASLAGKDSWAEVRVVGMVEGYREKLFKGASGKLAFFDLEDKSGKVTVRVRENQIDKFASVLTAGEPVVVSGKLRFPERAEDSEEAEGPREPTLLLDKAELLSDIMQQETKGILIRLAATDSSEREIAGLGAVLRGLPGPCPVLLVIDMGGGAEVQLALPKEMCVAANDALFVALERHFNRQVAELR